jgi:hypothetical protein
MLRFRWFDSAEFTPTAMLAVLFWNFVFWFEHGDDLARFNLSQTIAIAVLAALLCAVLFFLGPALRPPSRQLDAALRVTAVIYLVIWISGWLSLVCMWLGYPQDRQSPRIETGLLAAGILMLVFLTRRAPTRLMIHLGAAIMIAALLRVHSGWPAIPLGFSGRSTLPVAEYLLRGFSNLSDYVAPLALLGAWLAPGPNRARSPIRTASLGVALPVAASVVLTAVVGAATFASRFYRPSGVPNIAMALTSGASRTGEKVILLIFALTLLGPLRFGVRALEKASGNWLICGCFMSAAVWLAVHADWERTAALFELSTLALAAIGAILTANALVHIPEPEVDWTEGLSFTLAVGGIAFAWFWYAPQDTWGRPWLLPGYGVAFLTQLLCRAALALKFRNATRQQKTTPSG